MSNMKILTSCFGIEFLGHHNYLELVLNNVLKIGPMTELEKLPTHGSLVAVAEPGFKFSGGKIK